MTMAVLLEPPSIALPVSSLEKYVSVYEIGKKLSYEITLKDGILSGGRIGRTPTPLKAEKMDILYSSATLNIRKMFFRDADGKLISFADRREGTDVVWRNRLA